MTDRVHAAMDPMQPSRRNTACDAVPVNANRGQLGKGSHSVLASCDSADRSVGPGVGAFLSH
jgi:hypothetical protein